MAYVGSEFLVVFHQVLVLLVDSQHFANAVCRGLSLEGKSSTRKDSELWKAAVPNPHVPIPTGPVLPEQRSDWPGGFGSHRASPSGSPAGCRGSLSTVQGRRSLALRLRKAELPKTITGNFQRSSSIATSTRASQVKPY